MVESNGKLKMVFLFLAVLMFVAAAITLLPYKNIDDECMLGYKALCAFTPVSTLVLAALGIMFLFFRKKA